MREDGQHLQTTLRTWWALFTVSSLPPLVQITRDHGFEWHPPPVALLVAGGKTSPNSFTDEVHLFDATDWYHLEPMPSEGATGISGAGITQWKDQLYVIAGFNDTRLRTMYVLNMVSNIWCASL